MHFQVQTGASQHREASWPGEVVLALQKRLSYAEGMGNMDVDVPCLEDRPAGPGAIPCSVRLLMGTNDSCVP